MHGYVSGRTGRSDPASRRSSRTRSQSNLHAALSAQRSILGKEWPTPAPVRVRMALHSGQAEECAGDYFGPPVNRVARILSAGYGGQILLSQAVERLVADHLPTGAAMRDLGNRSLRT